MRSSLRFLILSGALAFVTPFSTQLAAAEKPGKLIRVTEKEADWAAAQRKNYPLNTCLVSDERLGSMGKAPEYIYRVEGQPDRLVVFCCSGCDGDFLASPEKFLAKLDPARSGAKSEGAPSGRP